MTTYFINSLEELATFYDYFANNSRNAIRACLTTAAKRDCETRALVWEEAARVVRQCKIMER